MVSIDVDELRNIFTSAGLHEYAPRLCIYRGLIFRLINDLIGKKHLQMSRILYNIVLAVSSIKETFEKGTILLNALTSQITQFL